MYQPATRRAGPALAAASVVALAVAGLWLGLAGTPASPTPEDGLRATVVDVPLPPPPPPMPAPPPEAAAPRNAGGSPRGSPPPMLAVPQPVMRPPAAIAAVPEPSSGSGQGVTGDGGGDGRGGSGGGAGSGEGAGYGSGMGRPAVLPRQIAGRLRWSDLPPDLRRARSGSDLTLSYRIGTDGRVSGCRVLVTSGRRALDEETCALLAARFRFRPARDEAGRAVAYVMIETHGWDAEPSP